MLSVADSQNHSINIDPRDEIVIDHGGDSLIVIPAHSQRIFLEVWANGAMEVLFYDEPQPGEDPSDRIHWLITGFDGEKRGFLLNVEDAVAVISGLSSAVRRAIYTGVPTRPSDG